VPACVFWINSFTTNFSCYSGITSHWSKQFLLQTVVLCTSLPQEALYDMQKVLHAWTMLTCVSHLCTLLCAYIPNHPKLPFSIFLYSTACSIPSCEVLTAVSSVQSVTSSVKILSKQMRVTPVPRSTESATYY
jgi:hypothetical protein